MEVGSLSGNRNLIVVICILLEIGAAVFYYFQAYQPLVVTIEDKKQIMEKKRKDVREIELTKQLLEETKQEIERLKTDIARLEKFFPEEVFIPRVLVLIENLSIATHVEIETIRPGKSGSVRRGATGAPTQPTGGPRTAPGAPGAAGAAKPPVKFNETDEYKTSEVSLKVKGTFQNIYNFMEELATFPKLVVVDKLNMSVDSASGEDGEGMGEGAPETGREVEVGGYVELSVDIPLTFYVQKKDSPEFKY